MSIFAIIPARAGSKTIPKKCLAPLGGKPLIAWSVEQALAASVDRTIVSTESEEIAVVAREWGAEVPFLRPAELATDTASTESVMLHAVNTLSEMGATPDFVLLLQATCPIRKPGAIDAALAMLHASEVDSVVSAREIHPFLWTKPSEAQAQYDFRNRPRRQDIADDDRLYEENGSIYATRTGILRRDGCRLGGRIVIYPMSALESIDIDMPEDLMLAEAALSMMEKL